jgi:flagellar biosynthetic protein FlhB
MAEFTDEKTLDPTPHRRQCARAEGQIPRSADFTSAGLLLGGLVVLVFTGGALLEFLAGMLVDALGGKSWMHTLRSGSPADPQMVAAQWHPLVQGLGKVLLPPLALVALLAVALNVVQTGFLFLPGKLAPDAERLNPWAGLRRIVSGGSGVRLTLGVLKLAVIGAVAFASVYQQRAELAAVGELELPRLAAFIWNSCLWTSLKVGSALLILAVVDYGYQRYRHERELRMTPQELREEMRNVQGDPQLATRRREAQRRLAGAASVAGVAGATVVVADASQAAVALRYDPHGASAPVVVAKASGSLVDTMRESANQHDVPVVERPSLAQALHQETGLHRPIESRQFGAVAQVFTLLPTPDAS